MYTKTLRQLVNKLFALRQSPPKANALAAQNRLKGIIISGPETREWAHKLGIHFTTECNAAFPDTIIELETVILEGSPEAMQSALLNHRAISGNKKDRCSFIITPGYTETHLVSEMRKFYSLDITHLYCVQGVPTRSFLETKKGRAGVHNTPMSPAIYVNNLQALIPNLKTVCIAYSAYREQKEEYDSIQGQRRALKKAFVEQGITVLEHVWDIHSIDKQELQTLLTNTQALITLDEPTVYQHRQDIIALCNTARVPLCTSELDSVFAGAAIGCGITFDSFAKPLIAILHELINDTDGYVASLQIPMQTGMRYNKRGMQEQGIQLSLTIETLMLMKSIYEADIIAIQ